MNQATAFHSRLRNFLRLSRRHDPDDFADAEPEIGLPDNELLNNGNSASPMVPIPTGGYKVRVEMLQVAVLIAMPSQRRTIHKNALLDQKHDIEEEDDDDEETPLPELLLGTTRVHYRQPKSGKEATLPVTPKAPLSPGAAARAALRQSMGILPEEEEPLSPRFR